MHNFNPRWSILAAVRGTGLLVDGKRIFTLGQCSEQQPTYTVYWGVVYAVLTESEAQLCIARQNTSPKPIEYMSSVQPQAATLARNYLDSRSKLFGDEKVTFLGISTQWQREKVSVHELRELATAYHDWIEECISESQSSKTSSE